MTRAGSHLNSPGQLSGRLSGQPNERANEHQTVSQTERRIIYQATVIVIVASRLLTFE